MKLRIITIALTISLILLSFVIGIGITYLLSIKVTNLFTEALLSSYISGAGSLLGGIFGGIVAFVVAKSQIYNEKERISTEKINKINNQLTLLIIELKSHLEVFEFMSKNKKDREKYRSSINIEIWKEVKYDLTNQIDQEDFKTLSDYYYDCRDLVNGTLPDYTVITDKDLELRINTLKKCIKLLEELKKHLCIK